MKKAILPIPVMTEGVVDIYIQDLTFYGLKKEHAIFLLGSFVYQTPNARGERKFSDFVEDFPRFQLYLIFFLKKGLLIEGREEGFYLYDYEIDWERYLENYEFDSIIVNEIIQREFPNFHQYLENAFRFLEPNISRLNPPF